MLSESQLGRRQEAAVAALFSNRTHEEAAREARITSRTLRRWMKRPDFKARLNEVRRESWGRDYARLQQGAPAAVTTLLKTLVDPKVKESLRVAIAKFVLESTQKSLEIETLELRISNLEQELAKNQRNVIEDYEELNVDTETGEAS